MVLWKEGKSDSPEFLMEIFNKNVQGTMWSFSISDVKIQEPYLSF